MREIKFKAFDKEQNKMVYVCELDWFAPIVQGGSTQLWVHNSYSLNEHEAIAGMVGQRYELLQYTGLKDKNGKEIYEGDIIQTKDWHTDENGRCVLSEANSYMKKTIVEYTTKHPFIGFTFHDKCEIIGNIYENPELLTK